MNETVAQRYKTLQMLQPGTKIKPLVEPSKVEQHEKES